MHPSVHFHTPSSTPPFHTPHSTVHLPLTYCSIPFANPTMLHQTHILFAPPPILHILQPPLFTSSAPNPHLIYPHLPYTLPFIPIYHCTLMSIIHTTCTDHIHSLLPSNLSPSTSYLLLYIPTLTSIKSLIPFLFILISYHVHFSIYPCPTAN